MAIFYAWHGSVAIGAPLYPGAANVQVKVTRLDLAAPADALLKTNRSGSVELDNPFPLTDGTGNVSFFTRRGRYQITAAQGMFSKTIDHVYIGPTTREKINKTASWTVSDDDDFTLVETTGAENIVVTVPDEETLDLGTEFEMSGQHFGSGTLTFVGENEEEEGGVEIIIPEELALGIPYGGTWTLMKSKFAGSNTWSLHGFLNLAG